MRNVHIPGAVKDVGAKQGYLGVSALYTSEETELGQVPVIKVAYELTPEEVTSLVEGGKVILTMVGVPGKLVPHRIEISTT